jgi:hypothetical protein
MIYWYSSTFSWFHVEILRNETIGYGYQTTKNLTVTPGEASGSNNGDGAAKAAIGLNASNLKSAFLYVWRWR